jgi:alpha-L-fucosidase
MATPDLQALREHSVPDWYEDAKLGIFIHWGLFSIPGFAAPQENISDAFTEHYDHGVVMTPYTEWYDNAIRVPGSPSAVFHEEQYGNRPYADFREPFARGLEQWDPKAWASLFARAGARYVVLVTKHHDGYSLWPSAVANPRREGWTSERDIVGELADACRAEGLRFGVYYSGGIDWAWNPRPAKTFIEFVGSVPGGDYPAYAEAQVRELIERYQPSVLWNDISWPTGLDAMTRLMLDYYESVPEGVVNDRWMHRGAMMRALGMRPVQKLADALLKMQTRRAAARGDDTKGLVPPRPAHYDFRTPEYTSFDEITAEKWEATRGMSPSFGYNRHHDEVDYEDPVELVRSFIDTVSKNGNLLLNVGPRGEDAGIPEPQVSRLETLGAWLASNGGAIYGTRPWKRATGRTADGTEVRFTQRGDELNVILMGTPKEREIVIPDVVETSSATVTRLADGSQPEARVDEGTLRITLDAPLPEDVAHAFRIEEKK